MKSILDKFLLRILDYEIPAILVGKQAMIPLMYSV